jgi:hypothetical protein
MRIVTCLVHIETAGLCQRGMSVDRKRGEEVGFRTEVSIWRAV